MIFDEIKLLKGNPELPFPIKQKEKKRDKIVINHRIAIPIVEYSSYFKTDRDITLVDINGDEIGWLCFTAELGEITINRLTESQFIAFLTESHYSNWKEPYKFLFNYLILKNDFYYDYMAKYYKYAPLWGGFSHLNNEILTNTHKVDVNEIKIYEINPVSNLFLENATRAICQPFAFERFLKFYHLLELRFDYDIIISIQSLNLDSEPEKIGKLLTEYKQNELNRLEDIIIDNCNDIMPIVRCLNNSTNFQDISYNLFFKFNSGKEGNPFKNQESNFRNTLLSGFEETQLRINGVNYQANYNKFILKLVSYWIYRIRCSIAHNKIGEYIISMDNEDYIVEFGEPLLKEVLKQCFKI